MMTWWKRDMYAEKKEKLACYRNFIYMRFFAKKGGKLGRRENETWDEFFSKKILQWSEDGMTNEEEKDSWRENCWNIFVPPSRNFPH